MPYLKEAFDVITLNQAKQVVLTNSTDESFVNETNYFIEKIQDNVYIDNNTVILDFGCGMGRISKELVERFDCNVFGIDISESMLTFAKFYVSNFEKFKALNSYDKTESIDIAISVLVLQHTENPVREINNIFNVLKPNGTFIVVNEKHRLVPVGVDKNQFVIWEDDKIDVISYIDSKFKKILSVPYINDEHEIYFYRKII